MWLNFAIFFVPFPLSFQRATGCEQCPKKRAGCSDGRFMIYPCNADGGSSRISLLQSAVVHVSLGVAEKLTALAQLGQQFNFDILKLCSYVISRLYKSVSFDLRPYFIKDYGWLWLHHSTRQISCIYVWKLPSIRFDKPFVKLLWMEEWKWGEEYRCGKGKVA